MACTQGSQAKFLVDTDATFDGSSERYDFIYETMQKKGRIVGARSITGSRKQLTERTRVGAYATEGRIAMYMNPADLDLWLPRILGTAESTDVFDVAEDLSSFPFFMLIDKVGGVFRYDTCYINRAIFRSRGGPAQAEGNMVEMILEIFATNEVTEGVSFPGSAPTLGVAANRAPYLFSDSSGAVTINSNVHAIKDFVLVIDNHLERRWTNSTTPTEICPKDRSILLRVGNAYTTTNDPLLYGLSAAATGVAGTLVFTNSTISTTFTFSGLQWADNAPTVQGKREIPLYIDFYGRSLAGGVDIQVNNDSVV